MKNVFLTFLIIVFLTLSGCENDTSNLSNQKNVSSELKSEISSNTSYEKSEIKKSLYSYAYDRLSEKQKEIYDLFESGKITEENPYYFETAFDFFSFDDVKTLYDLNHETQIWRKNTYNGIFKTNYLEDGIIGIKCEKELYNDGRDQEMQACFDKEVVNFLEKLPSKEENDYKKIKAIADLICEMAEYNYSAIGDYDESITKEQREINRLACSEYGIIVYKTAVCEGYARAFQYFAEKLDVESLMIRGEANNKGHAWNLVCLDGNWYHVDTTWMDNGENINYDYFLVSDKTIGKDHKSIHWITYSESELFALPLATSDYKRQ